MQDLSALERTVAIAVCPSHHVAHQLCARSTGLERNKCATRVPQSSTHGALDAGHALCHLLCSAYISLQSPVKHTPCACVMMSVLMKPVQGATATFYICLHGCSMYEKTFIACGICRWVSCMPHAMVVRLILAASQLHSTSMPGLLP